MTDSKKAAVPSALFSKESAMDIALAWREVEVAEELLRKIIEEIDRGRTPDIRDAFGRLQNGLQLGVPSGENGHRLFNVPWSLCRPVIETHIAMQRAKIGALTEKARIELAGGTVDG